jgi:UPF0755 protein
MGRIARFILRFSFVLTVLALIVGGGGYLYARALFEAQRPIDSSADGSHTVLLFERGSSLRAIARSLEDEGLISNALVFRFMVMLEGAATDLKAGEFSIPRRASMREIMGILRSGKSILHKITIPEGLTSAQAMRLISLDPILAGEMPEMPEEGALLPETYLFTRGETRSGLVQQMMDSHDALLAELWAGRQEGLPIDSPYEAVILASIVEKETGVASERARVAGVFVNRLSRRMKLQSDPTIIYGLTKGEPLGRGIRVSELNKDTPYNTYLIDGLPPTPIANPGRASLAAVLDPPATKDLYFVADGSGGHVFAGTLAQHNRNVAKWRRLEKQQ